MNKKARHDQADGLGDSLLFFEQRVEISYRSLLEELVEPKRLPAEIKKIKYRLFPIVK